MKFKLRERLVLTYLILAILGVGGLSIRFALQEKTRITDATEHDLEVKAFTIATAIGSPLEKFSENELPYADFKQSLDQLARTTETRLTVLTTTGDPIYDSSIDFRQLENQRSQIEVQQALQGLEQHQIRRDPISGEERLYAAAIVQQESSPQGVVQLSIPTAPMQAKIRQEWLTLAGSALSIIVIIVIASWWLSRYILRPISRMQKAAHSLANGDFDQRIPDKGTDELADLARAFNYMASQLNEMLTKQRLFVANASHELRTPLTNIKLRAEALLEGAYSDPTVSDKFLRDIENESARMEKLVKNLLTLSRLDIQTEAGTLVPINPCSLLKTVVRAFSPQAEQKQISLSLTCSELPPLNTNREQLHSVFDNLLSNAIKYSPPGSQISLSATASTTEIIFTVSDTGFGIPPQDLPHIFDRFYRVDKARTRSADPGGTGLGLSIVQSIIRSFGGQINVTSQPGHGTSFTIRLPRTLR